MIIKLSKQPAYNNFSLATIPCMDAVSWYSQAILEGLPLQILLR